MASMRSTFTSSLVALAALFLFVLDVHAQNPDAPCATGEFPCGISAEDFPVNREFNQVLTQNSIGVPDTVEQGDLFGASLFSGDFNGDGITDIAIGAPYEFTSQGPGVASQGAIHILFGSRDRVVTTPAVFFAESRYNDSLLAKSLAAGDFDGDGRDELAVGAIGDNAGVPPSAAEAVYLLRGGISGISDTGASTVTQESDGVLSTSEPFDLFGSALWKRPCRRRL